MILDKHGNKMNLNPRAFGGKSSDNSAAIVNEIARQFKDTSRKDISKWRTAIQLANDVEKPRRDYLMDLLDDLDTDGHLISQMEQRKAATLNTPFQIINKKTGEIDVEKTDFLQGKWFYNLIEWALEAKLYGHSLVEFQSFEGNKIKDELIPRRNVIPDFKQVVPDWKQDDIRINYEEDLENGWLLEFGKKGDLGLLNKIVPNLIWKRNIIQTWAEFCERFGIPLTTATTLSQDEKQLDLIEDMLAQLGEAAYAVFPKGTDIEIKEANRTDAYMVFDKKITRQNEEISKAITGGTMLSDNGSSKSQSEVHERNLEERLSPMDRRDITFVINDELLPLLIKRGYPFSEDDVFGFDVTQNLDLADHWKIVKEVQENHIVDPKWISKTFNVPIIGDKQEVLPPITATLGKGNPTAAIIAAAAMKVDGVVFPTYSAEACCEKHNLFMVSASYQNEMDDLHNELYSNIYNKKSTLTQEAKITALEGLRLLNGLRSGWGERAITAAYNEPDYLMLSMMEYNLFDFASSKTEARLASLSSLLIDKDKLKINSFADFKEEAGKVVDNFNSSWLKTEYNLSVAVGQNSASFSRALAEIDVIPYVQYMTAGDSNVRNAHALLNNRVFALKDAAARNINPPNDFGCRCELIQYPHTPPKGGITSGKDALGILGDGFKASQFNINRGDVKQVFTNKQFYHSTKGLPEKINSMNYKSTYGLGDYSAIKKGLNAIKLDQSITPKNVSELFRLDGKQGTKTFMGFDDYLKRKIIMKQDIFDKHTSGAYVQGKELRHQMFPHIQNVLNKPDEVWLHEYANKKFQSRYIKFYGDMAFVVDAEIGNNNLEIQTWYQMKASERKVRKGLLIKKQKD